MLALHFPDFIGLLGLIAHGAFLLYFGRSLADPNAIVMAMSMSVMLLIGLRSMQSRFPEGHVFHRVADWWFMAPFFAVWANMNQICDAVRRPLMDAELAAVDQRLLGLQPAVELSRHMHPLLSDFLFLNYSGYYFFVFGVGLMLAKVAPKRATHAYLAALGITFFLMLFGYAMVPALGPRFFQAGLMQGPIEGIFIAHRLDASFKNVAFFRDCFPSGHTTQTLIAAGFAARYLGRRIGALSLLIAVSIIFATLYCRMHYAIDLLAGVWLAMFGTFAAFKLTVALPAQYVVPAPQLARR